MKHKIKTATACYTGGGIYIFYGQLENGLYFQAWDECETIYVCNTPTGTEEAQYAEFYERHTVEELTERNYKIFWNKMLHFVLNGGSSFDGYHNYDADELKQRIIYT